MSDRDGEGRQALDIRTDNGEDDRAERRESRSGRRKKQKTAGQRHAGDLAFRAFALAIALQMVANSEVVAHVGPALGKPEYSGRPWAALGDTLSQWKFDEAISTSDAVVIVTTLLVFTVSFNIAYVATLLLPNDRKKAVRPADGASVADIGVPATEDDTIAADGPISAKEQWAGTVRALTVVSAGLSFAVSLATITKPGTFLTLLMLSTLTSLASRLMYASRLGAVLLPRELREAQVRRLSSEKNLKAWEDKVAEWRGHASKSTRQNEATIFVGTLATTTLVASLAGMFQIPQLVTPETLQSASFKDWIVAFPVVIAIMVAIAGLPSYLITVFSYLYFLARALKSKLASVAVILSAAIIIIPYCLTGFVPLLLGGAPVFAWISLATWVATAGSIWIPWMRGRGPGLRLWASVSRDLASAIAANDRELKALTDQAQREGYL